GDHSFCLFDFDLARCFWIQFAAGGDAAGTVLKKRIAVGQSAGVVSSGREIASTAAVDLQWSLGTVRSGKTFHWGEWFARDVADYRSAFAGAECVAGTVWIAHCRRRRARARPRRRRL